MNEYVCMRISEVVMCLSINDVDIEYVLPSRALDNEFRL